MSKPEIRSARAVHEGYLRVERLRIRLADGSEVEREVESHGDAVAVLPFDAERRCALVVRLFRAPVMRATGEACVDEACAGMIDPGETADVAIRREAREELGVGLRALVRAGRVWSSPGVSTERVTLFLAEYAPQDRTGAGGGVASEHERITPVELALADLADAGDRGDIVDAKLLTLLLALRVRRPDLFD